MYFLKLTFLLLSAFLVIQFAARHAKADDDVLKQTENMICDIKEVMTKFESSVNSEFFQIEVDIKECIDNVKRTWKPTHEAKKAKVIDGLKSSHVPECPARRNLFTQMMNINDAIKESDNLVCDINSVLFGFEGAIGYEIFELEHDIMKCIEDVTHRWTRVHRNIGQKVIGDLKTFHVAGCSAKKHTNDESTEQMEKLVNSKN